MRATLNAVAGFPLWIALTAHGFGEEQWKLLRWLPPGPPELRRQVAEWLKRPVTTPESELQKTPRGFLLKRPAGALMARVYANRPLKQGRYALRAEVRSQQEGRLDLNLVLETAGFKLTPAWNQIEVIADLPYDSEDANLVFTWKGEGELEARNIKILPVKRRPHQAEAPATRLLQPAYRNQLMPDQKSTVIEVPLEKNRELQIELLQDENNVALDSLSGRRGPGLIRREFDLSGHPPGGYRWRVDGRDYPFVKLPPAPDVVDIRDRAIRINQRPMLPVGLYLRSTNVEPARRLGLNCAVLGKIEERPKDPFRCIVDRQWIPDPTGLAILAWTFADEPDLNPELAKTTESSYQKHRREDPYHPVYTTCHVPSAYARVAAHTDILAIDPYPIATVSKPIWTIAECTDRAVQAAGPGRSVFLVNQAFGLYPAWNRVPTPAEERCMTYQALNHGARGIIFYVEREILWPHARDFLFRLEESPLAGEIRREARELETYERFFTSPHHRLRSTATLDVGVFEHAGETLYCIVNLLRRPNRYDLGSPELRGELGPLEVRIHQGPNMSE